MVRGPVCETEKQENTEDRPGLPIASRGALCHFGEKGVWHLSSCLSDRNRVPGSPGGIGAASLSPHRERGLPACT